MVLHDRDRQKSLSQRSCSFAHERHPSIIHVRRALLREVKSKIDRPCFQRIFNRRRRINQILRFLIAVIRAMNANYCHVINVANQSCMRRRILKEVHLVAQRKFDIILTF